MKKIYEKALNSVTSDWIKVISGILICLLAVFGALSNAPSNDYFIYVSKFLTRCLSFLFGSILTYGIYLIIFLIGLSFAFSNRKFKISIDMTIFGVVFIILGAIILIANSQSLSGTTYLTFNNFEEVFQKNMIEGFPDISTFSNSGIIGMFLVALINSGMTYIGSNVIGSLFLVCGIFFSFGKPAIKFTKVIIEYYKQTFAKKVLKSDSSFDIAKDVSYDTTAINVIKSNKVANKTNESLKVSQPTIQSDNSISLQETSKVIDSKMVEPNLNSQDNNPVFQTNRLYESNYEGLKRATFNPYKDEEVETNQIKSESINTPEFNNYQNPSESQNFGNNDEKENVQTTNSFERISDMFSIPKKSERKTETPVAFSLPKKEEKDENVEFIKPEINVNQGLETNTFDCKVEENKVDLSSEKVKNESSKVEEVETETLYNNKFELKKKKVKKFVFPNVDLLENRDQTKGRDENIRVAEERKAKINEIFADLEIGAQIVSYTIGPSVTQYDVLTEKNVSINGLTKYINDVSIRLGGLEARFVPIVPGKATSGLEISNIKSSLVNFKDCLEQLNKENRPKLTVPFGLDINGNFIAGDLREFPHLLVCGTTGSGKSIFMHSMIMSLIMRNSPQEMKLIMIDPKRVEFSKYREIPHLLCPPISEPNFAFVALNKIVDMMEDRYTLFEDTGVSNIKQYNQEALEIGKDPLPYIVLICDEFADLMSTNRKCSEAVVRIGQKSRAAGIHMIIATQRPSTDVITGVIKANLPVRVALSCANAVDSVTILGEGGAEKLLGNGDMLVMCPLFSKQGNTRVQGAFVDNKEIKDVCNFLKENGEPDYDPNFLNLDERMKQDVDPEAHAEKVNKANDDKYEEVKKWVMCEEFTSISKIQRTFAFGFPRAGKIFSQLEQEGIIAKENDPNNSKGRKVLVHSEEIKKEPYESQGSIEVTTMDYSKKPEEIE